MRAPCSIVGIVRLLLPKKHFLRTHGGVRRGCPESKGDASYEAQPANVLSAGFELIKQYPGEEQDSRCTGVQLKIVVEIPGTAGLVAAPPAP